MTQPDAFGTPSTTRDLLWTLIRTDFKIRYHGTLGGFLWALLKPLVMFAVLYEVFSFLFRDSPYHMNLLVGILLWNFFQEGTMAGLESLLRKSFLVTKAPFPRWIVIVTSLANAALTLVVFSTAIVIVTVLTHRAPRLASVALFSFYMVLYVVIVLGFSLGASVLFLFYRDLNQIWDMILQAGFFVAPIIYPIDVVPERYHLLLYVWPVTPIIQFSRDVLIGHTTPSLRANLLLASLAAAIFAGGWLLYHRLGPRAMERL